MAMLLENNINKFLPDALDNIILSLNFIRGKLILEITE